MNKKYSASLSPFEYVIVRYLFESKHAHNTLNIHYQLLQYCLELVKERLARDNLDRIKKILFTRRYEVGAKMLREYCEVPSYQRTRRLLDSLAKEKWIGFREVKGRREKVVWYILRGDLNGKV